MSLAHGQPRIRFADHANPGSMEALCFVPKTITLTKDVTQAENEDFWQAPAGTFIRQAFAYVITPLNGNAPTVTLGTDGSPDALITATDFDISTAGNWATNIGSTTASAATGLFLAAADTIRLAVTGTNVTQGKVGVAIEVFEMQDMLDRGPHFVL